MSKKRKLIFAVAALIFVSFFVAFRFISKRYVAPVLMYHSVNPQSNEVMKALIVSPSSFEKQISFLRKHDYKILPLETLVDLMFKKKLPKRAIAITFDDGYRDFYLYAFPIIKKYRVPVTMFLIVNEVSRKEGDRLTWEEIREMQGSGLVTFGSHSMDAEPLINIKSQDKVKYNIFESKRVLEDKLGSKVTMFSYPEGFLSDQIRELVIKAGYRLAVATKTGSCYLAQDPFAVKRIRISESAKNPFNLWIKASGYHTFFKDRKCK